MGAASSHRGTGLRLSLALWTGPGDLLEEEGGGQPSEGCDEGRHGERKEFARFIC